MDDIMITYDCAMAIRKILKEECYDSELFTEKEKLHIKGFLFVTGDN